MLPTGKIQGTILGVSVIAFEKDGKRVGMTDSWVTMVDNDRIAMLLGPQSTTKDYLEKGDIVGICSLNEHQMKVAIQLGLTHSRDEDKFINLDYIQKGSAILIPDASTQMICEFESMIAIKEEGHARLCIFKVLDFQKNDIPFLTHGRR